MKRNYDKDYMRSTNEDYRNFIKDDEAMKFKHYKRMVLDRVKLVFPESELEDDGFGSHILTWHDGERYGRSFDDERISKNCGWTELEARQEALDFCRFVVSKAICKIDKEQAQAEIKRAQKQ